MDGTTTVLIVLSSGALGALLATGLTALFGRWREQARLRADVMLAAVAWADETYLRLIDLHMAKDAVYTDRKPYLQPEEYRLNNRALRSLLLQASILAKHAIVYGEGRETLLLKQMRVKLLRAAQMLWRARESDWAGVNPAVKDYLATEVDPLRQEFERQLLNATGLPMRWLGLRPSMNRTEWSTAGLNDLAE
jgi:hypothetical protein